MADRGFGIRTPSLIEQLRAVLDQYPDDGQILKELIQNAEDAGAKSVKFVNDRRQFPAESLYQPDLKIFQGPALYAYNDAVFGDADWDRIGAIHNSSKKDDPLKVGKFGLGFKSVFHMTDLPSVISGDKIGFLDPHEKFFGPRATGKQWHLENDREEITSLPDQFEPFVGIFGGRDITFNGGVHKGTLFRFPLRTGSQDPSQFCSQLSEQIYASQKIDSLFKSFMTCAYMNLLFLSSLESIELYERTEGSEKPELIFQLEIDKDCIKGVRSKREEFLSEIAKVRQTNEWPEKPIQSTYELQFTETTYIHQSAASTPTPSKKAKKSVDKTSKMTKWMLTNHFSGGQVSSQLQELANDSKLGFLPWVAVAMCCGTKDEPFQQVKQKSQQPNGHFFCFLPLPLEEKSVTGLPVHISGFFALSQNRRQLKWPTADQERSALTDKALLWNICLVEEAVSVAYAELLNCAILEGFSPTCIYNAMPDCSLTDPKFEKMVTLMYRVTLRRQSFFGPTTDTSFSASRWHNASEVLFNDLSPNIDNVEDLVSVLMQSGERICTVPSHVEEALQKHEVKISKIQPGHVRTALKKPNVSTWVDSLSFVNKMSILKYILSDSSYGDIIGIKLLPRSDQIVRFQSSASDAVYIPTKDHPKELLPGLTHSLLETERVPSEVAAHLEKMATLGLTQLKILDKTSMAELIRRLFDPCRDNTKDWDQHTTNHPTHGWLQMAWEYLTRQFPDNLSRFEDLHILLDLASCRIVKLSSGLPALITCWKGGRLDDGLAKWLKALGVILFQNLPKFIEDHHAVVPKYISPPTPEGVLQALSNVQTQTNLEMIKEWPLAEKDKLRKLVSEASAHDIKSHRKLLMELPIFMSVGGTEYSDPQSSGNRVSLHEAPWVLHQSPSFSLRWKFIEASGTDSEMLVQQLGMRILDMNDLLREIVLADIEWYQESGEIDLLMKQVLTINMNEDEDIYQKVRGIPFVPNESGERFTASQLFDHQDSVVFDLFHGVCDIFPTGQYKDDPQLHAALKRLGLKTEREQITAEDIYKAAEYVQNMSAEGSAMQNFLIDKSEAIMTILRSRPTILKHSLENGNTLSGSLKRTRFIKVKPRPENYPNSLPWCPSDCTFLSPSELCSSIYENMIGSVEHVSDEVVDEEIAREFGWNERPTLSKVIAQLEQVVSHYTSREKGLFLPMILDIYGELFHPVRGDVLYVSLKSSSQKWIWNGDGFSSSKDVVPGIPPELQGIQLHPHLFVLPREVEQFSEQFSQYGVESKDKLEIILQVQSNIQIKYQQERVQSQITNSNAADLDAQRDLQTIIDLLHIVESMDQVTISQLQNELLVPVHSDDKSTLILKLVSQCTYCDMDWLQQGHDVTDISDEETESIFFVHEHVSMQTSEKLGVPTLMSRILDVEELDMNYGQSEPLTCRLHNLLKEGYTDGFSVPKELIQNADDAGAQEVKFLYDQRRNEDAQTCLIDEGMRSCQGPALWAYNDAVFTEEDFKNLVKLGAATKEKMSDKIGKFGLGFNAVYNLTDVPSFISSNSIAIFDPHMKHLGRAARSKPGIKINLKNRKKLQKLKNQFKPFNGIFGCNLDSTAKSCIFSYNATLFRFPLRTKEQSYKSEISDVHYDEKQVQLLLQKLVDSSSEVLLFTQNVKKISIYHLPKDGTPLMMQCIYETTKNISKVIRGLHLPEVQQTQILKASTQALQSAESAPSIPMPKDTKNQTVSLLLEMSSKMDAGSVSIIKTEEKKDFWLVTSCMGDLTSKMLTMCQGSGLVPTGGVAVQLKECSVEGSIRYTPLCTQKGTFFCYLPLPISSGFSFHVNGSFSVESNRKHLTEKTMDDKVSKEAEWNQIILKDVIPKALLFCLEDLRELTCGTPYSFSELWPTCGSTYKPVCEPLVQQYYASLFSTEEQQAPALFSNGKMWENVHNVGILTDDVKGSNIVTHAERILEDYLQERGKIYVKVPSETMKTMLLFAPGEIQGKIMFDLHRLYNEAVFPSINTLDGDVRDTLILYAIDQDDEDLNKLLQRYPCIPSTPHGELKQPCALMHPKSRAASLYYEEDGIFIKGTERSYLNPRRLLVLEKLGIFEDISCGQILERAKSVAGLHQTDNARGVERGKEILQYLAWRLSGKEGSKLESELRGVLCEVPFLPVKPKPDGYPLPWKGNHNNLAAPKECFSADVENLVSSTTAVVDRRELKMNRSVERLLQIQSRKDVELDQVWDQFDEAIAAAPKCGKFEKKLKDLIRDIYQYLNDLLRREPAKQSAISNALQKRNAVYIPQSQEFVSGSKVIFNSKGGFEPLLFGHPYDWRDFPDVMEAAGVREDFDIADYIKALQKPHQTYSKKSLPLYIRQIVSALQQNIEDEVKKEKVPLTTKLKSIEDKNGPIYLPDEDGVMSEAKHLCFDDCPWLENDDDDMHCAHKDLPYHDAIGLGVQTKRGEKLRKCSMGIPFGQKEKLTNRIKRILEGYPCDQDILKELLQNADDAKATEVHFVLDPRNHSTKLIFEDCWKPLQGPALCVYNNSPFTQADIEGISNLGEGSKSEDPNKTGQYGVGFNAVYHLTDAPSFLTKGQEIGETLCIFDPHCIYVPGASIAEPGRCYNDIPKLRKAFPDVFASYLDDMKESFPMEEATLFRLPLRNENMARQSKIKPRPVTIPEMQSLMETFRGDLFLMMLFLNNIRKISVSEINMFTGKLQNTYSVEAHLSAEDTQEQQSFLQEVVNSSERLKTQELTVDQLRPINVSFTMSLKDNKGRLETWLITQQFGFSNPSSIPTTLKKALQDRELGLLPRGGVAHMLQADRLPMEKFSLKKSRVFCFLPLPLKTNLPVHINGHFALDHEARRNLWMNTENTDVKTEWNNTLIEQTIAPCYTNMLQQKKNIIMEEISGSDETQIRKFLSQYCQLFPHIQHQENYIHYLSKKVYQLTSELNLRVLPLLRHARLSETGFKVAWFTPTEGVFFDDLDTQIQEPGSSFKEPSSREIVRRILCESNFNLLCCPMSIYTNYREADIQVKTVSPEAVLCFFQTYQRPDRLCFISCSDLPEDIGKTIFGNVDDLGTMLQFCKKSGNFVQLLEGCPLLVTEDNKLRMFSSRTPVFCSPFWDLLPSYAASFCHRFLERTFFCTYQERSIFKKFKVSDLAERLPFVLPEVLQNGGVIHWDLKTPSKEWIQLLWTYLHSEVGAVSDGNKIISLLKPLSHWCLLPVTVGQSTCLLQVSRTREVMDNRDFIFRSGIFHVLQKLGVPQLAYDILQQHSEKTARAIISNPSDPCSMVIALEGVAKRHNLADRLNVQKCEVVLRYFCQYLDVLKSNPELKWKLCSFPFFLSAKEEIVSIEGKDTYIAPSSIPLDGMQLLEGGDQHLAFLKPNVMLQPLYTWLGCRVLSECEMYCDFILPIFEILSEEERIKHLKFISVELHYRSLQGDWKRLIDKLSHVKFLPDSRSGIPGTLSTASAFYDPYNEVFKAMLTEEDFPSEPFRSLAILCLMREIGLQQQVTSEKFIEFAKAIERGAILAWKSRNKTALQKRENQARVVVTHLLSRENVFNDGHLLRIIKDMAFLPQRVASSNLQSLCPCGNMDGETLRPFICFNGAVLYKQEHEHLSWTSVSFLEQWAEPRDRKLCEILGVKEIPSLEQVIDHCCNVCHNLEERVELLTAEQSELLSEIMGQIYQHLERYQDKEHPYWTHQLQHLACVLVDLEDGKRFVYPSQVATSCVEEEEEIKPYLFAVPSHFTRCKELFKLIGSTDRPSCCQYATVLEMIHKDTEGKKLEPNEKKKVLKAMGFLFKKLRSGEEWPEQVKLLYLLTSAGELRQSKDIIFIDNMSHFDRLQKFPLEEPMLARPSKEEIGPDVPSYSDVAEFLPECLRLRYLTDVVKEKLHSEPSINILQEHPVKWKIKSDFFYQAVMRLFRHAGKTQGFTVSQQDSAELQENIKNIKLHFATELTTVLEYKGEVLSGSERTQSCFYQKAHCGQQSHCFYLKSNFQMSNFSLRFVEILNSLSKGRLSTFLHHLCSILDEKVALQEISRCLDDQGIPPDDYCSDTSVLPIPGTYLHIEDQHLLSENFHHFECGEYVGYEVEDPLLKSREGLPTYIYAIVLEEIKEDVDSQTSDVLRRYKIRIGSEEEDVFVVTANDLYKFKRTPKDDSKDVVLYDKTPTEDDFTPTCLEDIKEDITKTL
ncbi:sacsin [Lingula anatina]|uniref:Sacsin n=1 Tax=Lingula anatina TaxID=7574 RepID=A0A1S3JM44_LINAN|nr:sacsin [Lingula anatina]|eukprot:XP_013411447.1 sacsin [Lingula anatina]